MNRRGRNGSTNNCPQCADARLVTPGAYCALHETSTSVTVTRRAPDTTERVGPIGPVPIHCFSYVSGPVPRFDDDGKRIL